MGGGGGWGKNQKKIHARENAKKKFRAKKKGKKKIHAEGRSNCDFYLVYKICQSAYYASINVKPEGGGRPRAYVGHLTSIAFPTIGNLT